MEQLNTKRIFSIGLALVLAFSMFFVQEARAWQSDEPYDDVVLRGDADALDWSSNGNPLTFNEEEDVWESAPIPLNGGEDVQYKFVYDGEWMPGDNLTFTPAQTGQYVFVFHPGDERRVDVRAVDEYDGSVTLRLEVPDDTPDWRTPTVASNLNNFNHRVTEMSADGEGHWRVELAGPVGEELNYVYSLGDARFAEVRNENRVTEFTEEGHEVKDVVETWKAVPIAENVTHDFNHQPFIPSNGDVVTVEVEVEHYGPITDGAVYYTTDGSVPDGARGDVNNGEMASLAVEASEKEGGLTVSTFVGTIPQQKNGTPVKYKIDVWDEVGEGSQFADTNSQTAEEATEFAYYVDEYVSPEWAKNATIYHIFIDRFKDGDSSNNEENGDLPYEEQLKGWMGGDLAGVQEKLDYVEDLGVNTIYLSPVFDGPYSHGYHPADFKSVDERFGDPELLKEVIDEAHERGMKVIYDFVPNHTSDQHPFFQDALENGKDSDYYNWYTFTDWPDRYETFYGIDELPQFNNDNMDARNYMIEEVVPYWLDELDFDGFRLDYAKGPSYSFWVDFRHAVKQADPDTYIFGEIWDNREKINSYAGQLDGALDFVLHDTMKNVFAHGGSMQELSETVEQNVKTYPEEYIMTSFLDNHDVPRFLFEAGDDVNKLKLASATQFALPGSPIIYYGTEVGMSQSRDHNEYQDWSDRWYREMMPWEEEEQNQELLSHYKEIIKLREDHSAFRTGDFQELHVDQNLFAFERRDKEGQFIVLSNKGEETEINLNEVSNEGDLVDVTLHNVFDEDEVIKPSDDGTLSVRAPAQAVTIYEVREKAPRLSEKELEEIKERMKGSTRFEAAVAFSKAYWTMSEAVVLKTGGNGDDVVDESREYPILFTKGNSLHPATRAELERLGAEKAIVKGGSGALSRNVRADLKELGIEIERVR
ncbi:alpha-amylase family glycosyl hydrolase [Shouchella shacheensis]|uniref:alpha-amylase family glycosyl hydrolase n=1 Tax=Shouchella shacheensis TaxID=1649580 RepID=UPI0009E7B90B|nr:alpha-amylase family glycosyl hydrolase [Shouchella shacheensis]